MSSNPMTLETLDIATPEHYERNGYPYPEWAYLRAHAPVFWYERDNVEPFWAITKRADVIELSKQPEIFLNETRLAVFTKDLQPPPENTVRHLLNMDPPDHAAYRKVVSQRFTPRTRRDSGSRRSRESPARCWTRPDNAVTSTSCRTSPPSSRSP